MEDHRQQQQQQLHRHSDATSKTPSPAVPAMPINYPHLLSLRVMRLYNYPKKMRLPVLADSIVHRHEKQNVDGIQLPEDFGSIYVSQSFCSYIIVSNVASSATSSIQELTAVNPHIDVSLIFKEAKMDLKDSRAKYSGTPAPHGEEKKKKVSLLGPGDIMDMIVQQNIGQVGEYSLQVSVRYEDSRMPDGRKVRRFKKMFSFEVRPALKVLDVKQSNVGDYEFVQLSFQNLMKSEVCIDDISISNDESGERLKDLEVLDVFSTCGECDNSADGLEAKGGDAVGLDDGDVDESVATLCGAQLQPNAIRRALLRLKRRGAGQRIGTARILWRSKVGVPGEFVIRPPLFSCGTVKTSIKLSLHVQSARLRLDRPCMATISVQNNKTRAVNLRLTLCRDKVRGVAFVGLTSFDIGRLTPGASSNHEIAILPTECGFLQIQKEAILVVDQSDKSEWFLSRGLRMLCGG